MEEEESKKDKECKKEENEAQLQKGAKYDNNLFYFILFCSLSELSVSSNTGLASEAFKEEEEEETIEPEETARVTQIDSYESYKVIMNEVILHKMSD